MKHQDVQPAEGRSWPGHMEHVDAESLALDSQSILEQYAAGDTRGLLLMDNRRRVLAINDAAREIFKYSGPVDCRLVEIVHDVNVGFAVGEALHDRRRVWHEAYTPDPDRLLRFILIPLLSVSEEPVLVIATIEDITNLRHLETVRRDFVANVSHELRTPLASIQLLVETLQRGAMNDADAGPHFLHRIEVETLAMSRLVEELLELSRLETGALGLELGDVSLRHLMDVVVGRLEAAASQKSIAVTIDVATDLPQVRADSRRLEQILMNLIHNAIKFTPGGGVVSLHAARKGPGVQVDVSDTGAGLSSAEAARVFERFYKVDKGRNRAGGAGLGLGIARHLVELHGSHLV
ncbi:MAG: sensor histidine kinase, partial [Chloroflexota bacterium]